MAGSEGIASHAFQTRAGTRRDNAGTTTADDARAGVYVADAATPDHPCAATECAGSAIAEETRACKIGIEAPDTIHTNTALSASRFYGGLVTSCVLYQ